MSILFVSTLIFTKSRSGFLGFFVESLIFAILTLKNYPKKLIVIAFSVFLTFISFGSPWTPSISQFLDKKPKTQETVLPTVTSQLEAGGTESGDIRKIVWKGALSVFTHYPIFGTGVETFAYSYYQFRPIEHNLTSEWDFLYNKAHNEYLNYMANSGILGISSYLAIILFSIFVFLKNRKNIFSIALLSGFVSLLISNFFGFSVTLTNLELFLFPAVAICLSQKSKERKINFKENDFLQNSLLVVALLTSFYIIFLIGKYWYADILYSRARTFNNSNHPEKAIDDLDKAIYLIANEPNYHMELAQSYAQIGQKKVIAEEAVKEGRLALSLNPVSINLVRSLSNVYTKLSSIDPQYLNDSVDILKNSTEIAPHDPKLYFQLGLSYGRIEDLKNSIENLKKAIDLKPDYKDARLALAIVYESANQKDDAKNQLEYILKYIAPGDKFVKTELEKLK
ncbi:O-antigen ligase family protein [Candidatus Woesebacteria bacterium]|nr:O-antigen ligase family protein [Candidatus Woesebacteria bacterium]